jgi:hypothetical protein
MTVTQSIGALSPIVVVTFTDIGGDLFNHLKPDMADVFTLKFIRAKDNQVEIKLKIVNVEYTGTVLGSSGNVEFRLTLMGENWYEMNALKFNRGWSDKLISDVVSDVVSVGKFRDVKIHQTKNRSKSVVQPHSTNVDFLKWLKTQAISNTVDGHYCFGVNYDNQFFFKNISQHIIDYRPRIRNNEIITFTLAAPEDNVIDAVRSKNNNNEIPAYFLGFSGETNYSEIVRGTVSGGKVSYVDFETGQYKTKNISLESLDANTLSDKTSLHAMHQSNNNFKFFGSDSQFERKARVKQSEELFNSIAFKLVTEGAPNLSIFDLVYVDVNNTTVTATSSKNSIHSGYYIVKNAITAFSFSNTVTMSTTMTLSRHGYNINNIDDFSDMVETKRGKI